MKVRNEAVAKDYPRLDGSVMFPSTHDIFDFPEIGESCFIVFEKLLKSGNNVLVKNYNFISWRLACFRCSLPK
jgi:hypothetical protein